MLLSNLTGGFDLPNDDTRLPVTNTSDATSTWPKAAERCQKWSLHKFNLKPHVESFRCKIMSLRPAALGWYASVSWFSLRIPVVGIMKVAKMIQDITNTKCNKKVAGNVLEHRRVLSRAGHTQRGTGNNELE